MLEIIADPQQLETVIAYARSQVGGAGRPEDDPAFNALDLVMDELFLNIATHGSPGEPVFIDCVQEAPGLARVEFQYPGPAFDPTADAPMPDLDAPLAARRVGGLGLFLVREATESISYHRDNELNYVSVRVRVGV